MEAFSTGLLELLTDYQGFLEIVQLTIGKEFGAHEFLCGGPFPNCDVIDFMILTTVGWKPDKVKAVRCHCCRCINEAVNTDELSSEDYQLLINTGYWWRLHGTGGDNRKPATTSEVVR